MSSVAAQVRYLNPEWKGRAEMPCIGDRESRRANTSKHGVEIHDARSIDVGLDTSGFVLTEHTTRMGDFHDEAEVAPRKRRPQRHVKAHHNSSQAHSPND